MSGAPPDGLAPFVVYNPAPSQRQRFAHEVVRRYGEDDPQAAPELLRMIGLVDENGAKTG